MIGRSGERGSGISVLAARHDDDDDDYSYLRAICKQLHLQETILNITWFRVSVPI